MLKFKKPIEFDWNKGNIDKNVKHKVSNEETEEAFLDEARQLYYKDKLHSEQEDRFILLGKTKQRRLLYIAFTMRGKKIRIISARDVNKKEVKFYHEEKA